MAPLVSAVVVNHNGAGYVDAAVASLLAQEGCSVEVIVVDNASTDGSADALEARFGDRIRLVRSLRNAGYGGGNNAGLALAQGRFLLLLNSDAEADRGLARAMVGAAEASPRIGMVAAKVLVHSARGVIDNTGHLMYGDGLNRGRGRQQADHGQFDALSTALFPSGAAALYRREMLDDVGAFDESFFLYGDDADLGLRGRVAGWECAFAPGAVAYHHYSRTAGAYSTLKAFHVERNRVWVLLKIFPWSLVVVSPFLTALRLGVQAFGVFAGRGAAHHLARERSPLHLVAVTLRAYASALRGVPGVLRARRRIPRRLSGAQTKALLREFRLSVREVALTD
jgi:GT2 family glycosyltransferase